MIIGKRNKFLWILLFCIVISLNSVKVKAGFDSDKNININEVNCDNVIDSSIVNKEISKWSQSKIYNYSDLVLYNDKIFFACNTIQGFIPEESKDWLLKADLSVYRSNSSKGLCLYANSSLDRASVAKIIAYNADLSKSKYQFSIRALLPGVWWANVNSVIQYDNGRHTIIKNDSFSNDFLYLGKSQVRNYFYSGITSVTVILAGGFNGETLKSVGATLYP